MLLHLHQGHSTYTMTNCCVEAIKRKNHSAKKVVQTLSSEWQKNARLQVHQDAATHDNDEPAHTGVEIDDVDKNIEQSCWIKPIQPVSVPFLLLFHEWTTLCIHLQVLIGCWVNLRSNILISRLVLCRKWVWKRGRCCHRCHWYLLWSLCTQWVSSSSNQAESKVRGVRLLQLAVFGKS